MKSIIIIVVINQLLSWKQSTSVLLEVQIAIRQRTTSTGKDRS
jgi:hypothetical protein